MPPETEVGLVPENDEMGAGRQTYYFVNDDKALRAFIFETVTTNDGVWELEVLNAFYEWISAGKMPSSPPTKLQLAK